MTKRRQNRNETHSKFHRMPPSLLRMKALLLWWHSAGRRSLNIPYGLRQLSVTPHGDMRFSSRCQMLVKFLVQSSLRARMVPGIVNAQCIHVTHPSDNAKINVGLGKRRHSNDGCFRNRWRGLFVLETHELKVKPCSFSPGSLKHMSKVPSWGLIGNAAVRSSFIFSLAKLSLQHF